MDHRSLCMRSKHEAQRNKATTKRQKIITNIVSAEISRLVKPLETLEKGTEVSVARMYTMLKKEIVREIRAVEKIAPMPPSTNGETYDLLMKWYQRDRLAFATYAADKQVIQSRLLPYKGAMREEKKSGLGEEAKEEVHMSE